MFPFPEIDGDYQTGTGLFTALYVAFDLGTNALMNRFIGETGIKDPKRMVQYLQYFIWYQMFSGLIQLTIIAIWAFFYPPQDLLYLTWIFLLYSTTQYPAMQSTFRNALGALQQFDKSTILSFLESDVIQKLNEIGFVLLFRYTLGQNPQYGIIIACSMGLILGKSLDDYLVMAIGMKFFNNSLKKYGITVRDCFRHDFSWSLVKEAFVFGVKTGFPGAIGSFAGLLVLVWWLGIPQYTTFIALFGLAASIVNFVQGLYLDLGGAISESYLNGKKILCQYYIGQTWRFDAFIQLLLYAIIFIVSLILQEVLVAIGLSYYLLAIPFILPIMIRRFTNPYEHIAGEILAGAHKPNFFFFIQMLQLGINMFFWWLFLVFLKIPQTSGIETLFWLMPMGDMPGVAIKLLISYIYIHKKIVPLKIPLWQTFGGTSIAGIFMGVAGYAYYIWIFVPMNARWTLFPALIPAIFICILILPLGLYIPMTVLLGVWDSNSVDSFRKASKISGFAKILVIPMFKALELTIPFARLHNRFAADESQATREAMELMEFKKSLQIH
jgi:hypothetical protein